MYPFSCKARMEPLFSSLKTYLFSSFAMVNNYYLIPITFEVLLGLFSPSSWILLQKDSDDHISGFYTYSRSIKIGLCDHLISASLSRMGCFCVGIQQTLVWKGCNTCRYADLRKSVVVQKFRVFSEYFPELYIVVKMFR